MSILVYREDVTDKGRGYRGMLAFIVARTVAEALLVWLVGTLTLATVGSCDPLDFLHAAGHIVKEAFLWRLLRSCAVQFGLRKPPVEGSGDVVTQDF